MLVFDGVLRNIYQHGDADGMDTVVLQLASALRHLVHHAHLYQGVWSLAYVWI